MAASQGAQTGVRLAVAVGAMVLAFVALVAMANGLLGGIRRTAGLSRPLVSADPRHAVRAGVSPARRAELGGSGRKQAGSSAAKIVLNEFVAFIDLGAAKDLSDHTIAIVTFALCGFANFSSIAIQMAVPGSLAPNQRAVIARLGMKALAAGALLELDERGARGTVPQRLRRASTSRTISGHPSSTNGAAMKPQ